MWPFNYRYPHTNYHDKDSDLSWFLEQFENLREDWNTFRTTLTAEWNTFRTTLTAEWAAFKTSVEASVASLASTVNNFFNGQAVRLEYGGTGVSATSNSELLNTLKALDLNCITNTLSNESLNIERVGTFYIPNINSMTGRKPDRIPSGGSNAVLISSKIGNSDTQYAQILIVDILNADNIHVTKTLFYRFGRLSVWQELVSPTYSPFSIDNGGTGARTAADARTNLGLGNVLADLQTALDRALQAFPVETKSGAIASFNSGAAGLEVKSLSFDINPIQEGTGDPSPENVRPISGRTGADVVISPTLDAQDGTTYTLTWQTEAGTVYGGNATYLGGGNWRLTSTMAMVDLGTPNWGTTDTNVFYTTSIIGKAQKAQPLYCSQYATPYVANIGLSRMTDKTAQNRTDSDVLYIKDTTYSDAASFKSAMSGVQLVYELATPLTYTLTTEELINSLYGTNNIWSNSGNTTATIRCDPTLYIAEKTQ